MVAAYKKNAKIITDKFDALGIKYTGGIHAPYIWFNCGVDSWAFFDYMLKRRGSFVRRAAGSARTATAG